MKFKFFNKIKNSFINYNFNIKFMRFYTSCIQLKLLFLNLCYIIQGLFYTGKFNRKNAASKLSIFIHTANVWFLAVTNLLWNFFFKLNFFKFDRKSVGFFEMMCYIWIAVVMLLLIIYTLFIIFI